MTSATLMARSFATLILWCVASGLAGAQDNFPWKPVRIVVPTSPGGVTDTTARALAQRLTEAWGQQVLVENRAGANHVPAMEYVAKSPPDGHTLMVVAEAPMVVFPHLYSKLAYNPLKDFAPVAALVGIQQALIAHPSLPANNVRELIALAKSKPGGLNYGAFGHLSSGHLNMEMFQSMAGVKLVAVQYKGATPALTDVIGGHIPMMFINVSSALPAWRAGQVKMLAIGSSHRLAELPDIPTVAEDGLPGFEARSWFALYATGGTPRNTVAKINAATRRIFDDPGFREKFLTPYLFESMVGPPDEFAAFMTSETERFGKILAGREFDGGVTLAMSGRHPQRVMAGLDPAIHERVRRSSILRFKMPGHLMDCRIKSGNDNREISALIKGCKIF